MIERVKSPFDFSGMDGCQFLTCAKLSESARIKSCFCHNHHFIKSKSPKGGSPS